MAPSGRRQAQKAQQQAAGLPARCSARTLQDAAARADTIRKARAYHQGVVFVDSCYYRQGLHLLCQLCDLLPQFLGSFAIPSCIIYFIPLLPEQLDQMLLPLEQLELLRLLCVSCSLLNCPQGVDLAVVLSLYVSV
jgi:hypothetical protein